MCLKYGTFCSLYGFFRKIRVYLSKLVFQQKCGVKKRHWWPMPKRYGKNIKNDGNELVLSTILFFFFGHFCWFRKKEKNEENCRKTNYLKKKNNKKKLIFIMEVRENFSFHWKNFPLDFFCSFALISLTFNCYQFNCFANFSPQRDDLFF